LGGARLWGEAAQKKAKKKLNFSAESVSINVMSSDMADLESGSTSQSKFISRLRGGLRRATSSTIKENVSMAKTLDAITEIIRNPKHPFRKADDRPVKAQKHRYERRKIKEYLRLGDWGQGNPA
jgi:hypothetical protein